MRPKKWRFSGNKALSSKKSRERTQVCVERIATAG
jgi:hypothetical protein